MWMTSCTGSARGGFWGIWEKSVEFPPRKKTVDFRGSPRPCDGCRTWFEADGKVVIERLCLSLPHVEKPFNSKVIKSFVPELRSRKCFLCFGIPMLSICALWTFYVHFTYPYHGYVTQSSMGFRCTNRPCNLGQTTRSSDSQQYKKRKNPKRTFRIVDFCCSAKREISTYTSLENWKKPKKLWNMKVTVIPILIGAFGTVTK